MLYNGTNNGELFLSQRDAGKAIGRTNRKGIKQGLDELIDRGFIKSRTLGSFDNKTKLATSWILTMHKFRDEPPTKEFMRWGLPRQHKTRASKRHPLGLEMSPAAVRKSPDELPVGGVFETLEYQIGASDGPQKHTTYNMPSGELSQSAGPS